VQSRDRQRAGAPSRRTRLLARAEAEPRTQRSGVSGGGRLLRCAACAARTEVLSDCPCRSCPQKSNSLPVRSFAPARPRDTELDSPAEPGIVVVGCGRKWAKVG